MLLQTCEYLHQSDFFVSLLLNVLHNVQWFSFIFLPQLTFSGISVMINYVKLIILIPEGNYVAHWWNEYVTGTRSIFVIFLSKVAVTGRLQLLAMCSSAYCMSQKS
jgi:hypothetical protein